MILEEKDYLQHQLFLASVSPIKIRNRKRSRWINSILILIFSMIAYYNGNIHLSLYFGITSIVFFIIYPVYSRWSQKRQYSKYVKDNFSSNFGKDINFEFRDDEFYSQDETGEGSIKYADLEIIFETKDYFILLFTEGDSYLIAKENVDNLEFIRNKIQELQVNFGIPFEQKLDWVWK